MNRHHRHMWSGHSRAALIASLSLVLFAPALHCQTNFTPVKRMSFNTGFLPYSRITAGPDGALYGTTAAGGVSNAGAIFRVNPDGSDAAILKSFLVSDGAGPQAGLALASNGFLFGAAYVGGISNFGTLFKISTNGSGFEVLHHFTGGSDGKNPNVDPIIASDGAIYGITYFSDSATRGTVYKINPDGSGYTVLHRFTGSPDGQQPVARLLQGSDGMLYGTAMFGGITSGAIYKMSLDGSFYLIIHAAQSGEGRSYQAGLCQSANGFLYGTAYLGGSSLVGTIFRLDIWGNNYSTVRSFQTTGGDAQNPDTDLIEDADGFLYGGAYAGGAGGGAIFKIKNDGSEYAVLHSCATTNSDFYNPNALTRHTNGLLYGTMRMGGGGAGGVYALSSSPLPPRVLALIPSANTNYVQFATTSRVQYEIQRSTNLSSWTVLATSNAPANGNLVYSDVNPPPPAAFYRLRQQ
jgi:uncharacterized repeat protein (TIGR03803 family)